MNNTLRTLLSTLVTAMGLSAAAQGHLIYVAGHANPCNPAMNGSVVTITVDGVLSGPVSITTTLNENCYYSTQLLVPDTAGLVTVTGSCGNGAVTTGTGTYFLIPPATSDVIVNLDCGNTPTSYHVTVQGSVSPCELMDNTVTVRCTTCTPWVETSVPVDVNCNYSAVLDVPNMTGTIVVATGCTNGSVPNNTIQYIVNPGQTGTMVTLLLSCGTAPGEACFTVAETAPFTAVFSNCSTGCIPPFTYLWDFSGPSGGTQQGDVVNFTFPGAGTYSVCLNITGSDGCLANTCQQVYVDAQGNVSLTSPSSCQACFTISQAMDGGMLTPFTANFTNCSTGNTPLTYQWWLPNGSASTQANESWVFPGEGIYGVCLTVSGLGGCINTLCDTVVVDANGTINPTPGDCQADFWVIQAYQNGGTPNGEPIPDELWIWNLSSGGTGNYQFLWNFGDGNTSTEAFPTHIYTEDGPYMLCLTVNDNSGCTDTYCDSIAVDANGLLQGLMEQGIDPHATLSVLRSEGFTINVRDPLTMAVPEHALSALATWPNPTQDRLEISFNSIKRGQARTEVIDANGRRVVATMSQLVNGQNRITLDVTALPAGMYLLRIGEGGQTVVRRFVKG
jgi:PKD repeat protein